jgi:hypothetical protein
MLPDDAEDTVRVGTTLASAAAAAPPAAQSAGGGEAAAFFLRAATGGGVRDPIRAAIAAAHSFGESPFADEALAESVRRRLLSRVAADRVTGDPGNGRADGDAVNVPLEGNADGDTLAPDPPNLNAGEGDTGNPPPPNGDGDTGNTLPVLDGRSKLAVYACTSSKIFSR